MTKKEALSVFKRFVKSVNECEVNKGFIEGDYKKLIIYLSQEHFEIFNIILGLIKEQERLINKIKKIITPTKENDLSLDIQRSEMYKKLDKLLEDK